MKYLLLLLLIAPIVYLAARQKKWYLYLAMAFIAFLPEQFAISVHDKIPLLSGSRLLILLLSAFWLWDKWKTRKLSFPISLVLYFGINLLISVVNLHWGFDEVKRVFLLIFEQVFLVIMIADLIKTREEFDRSVDFLILGCTALAIASIVQTVFEYDILSVLHLQETLASVQITNRMGLVRAYGTYNAISYGCYCAFMAAIIVYRTVQTKKLWLSAAFALNFMALICTLSRSAWICLGAIALLMIVVYRLRLIRPMLVSAGLTVVLCIALCFIQPNLVNAFTETGKSVANTLLGVLPDSVVSMLVPDETHTPQATMPSDPIDPSDATEPAATEPGKKPTPGFQLDENFGLNPDDPSYSRMVQWSAVEYMIQEGHLLFGYGYNALPEGKLHFYYDKWNNDWTQTDSLDVGLIALITESGLIGFLASMGLLAYMLIESFLKKKKQVLDFFQLTIFMIPLYLLLNFLAAFMNMELVWLFFGLYYAYRKLDKEHLLQIPEQTT